MKYDKDVWKIGPFREPVKRDAAVFVMSVAGIALLNLYRLGSLYLQSTDGDLYISVAMNFVETGHFIQTARDIPNFVVPFGLPLIYTVLYALFQSVNGILFCQYLVFGCTVVLVQRITRLIFENTPPLEFAAAALFFWHGQTASYINPGALLTETWYMPLILLWIYVYLGKQNSYYHTKLLLCSFALVCIRPAFSVFLLASIVLLAWHTFREKTFERTCGWVIAGFCLLFAVNILVNYRETNHFVFLENYSGESIYLANNPGTNPYGYSSDRIDSFADSEYWKVKSNDSLTLDEENSIFSRMAKEYIRNHPVATIRNMYIKFYNFFVQDYHWDIWIGALAFFLLKLADKKRMFIVLLIAALEGIITSMGLYIPRYSVFILPIFIIFKLWFIVRVAELGTQLLTARKGQAQ